MNGYNHARRMLFRTALMLCIGATAAAFPHGGVAAAAGPVEQSFPSPARSYLKDGDFIDPGHVRRIRAGMSKDQVRLEIGNPHFSEGIFRVREWNYVFQFYAGADDARVTCQFQVDYDKSMRVAETHWNKSECHDLVDPPATTVAVRQERAPLVAPQSPKSITLDAGGLFAFAKSGLQDIQPGGREQLDALVERIKQEPASMKALIITGHSDRIGSDSRNFALSQARAASVRDYLIQQGIDGNIIRIMGAGPTRPIVMCHDGLADAELRQCLQPNRRVEVEAIGAL
jgi:OmpA-OmpF porin, OOP family